jgi:hypothetical protein
MRAESIRISTNKLQLSEIQEFLAGSTCMLESLEYYSGIQADLLEYRALLHLLKFPYSHWPEEKISSDDLSHYWKNRKKSLHETIRFLDMMKNPRYFQGAFENILFTPTNLSKADLNTQLRKGEHILLTGVVNLPDSIEWHMFPAIPTESENYIYDPINKLYLEFGYTFYSIIPSPLMTHKLSPKAKIEVGTSYDCFVVTNVSSKNVKPHGVENP